MKRTILTTKHTCDEQGNWIEIPVRLTRSGNGWIEEFIPARSLNVSPDARADVEGEQVARVA